MKKIFVIAGCNGAGKTTASYTILPELLDCREFVNADEIARGLSPFQPETANLRAGRLMLERINFLIDNDETFAFETTLSSISFLNYLARARKKGYESKLVFFWLDSDDLAVKRVQIRVEEGGHDIPIDVVRRRYVRGLKNFFKLYKGTVDSWMFVNNSGNPYEIIAEGRNKEYEIHNEKIWLMLNTTYHEQG